MSGGIKTVDIQTLSVTFSNMTLRSACFIEVVFSGKSDTSGLGITLLTCCIIRILVIGLTFKNRASYI